MYGIPLPAVTMEGYKCKEASESAVELVPVILSISNWLLIFMTQAKKLDIRARYFRNLEREREK